MSERNSSIRFTASDAVLPCAAAGSDPQDQARKDRVPVFAGCERGDYNGGELLGRHVSGSEFGCNLGAETALYTGTCWNATEHKMPHYQRSSSAKSLTKKGVQLTLNQRVPGSSPGAPTTQSSETRD